jgi:outer membrane lipoprotein SlyB
MGRPRHLAALAWILVAAQGCAPDYSPNTYAPNAVQQASKVERGVVIGYRQVKISANGTVGVVSGGAVGGVLGAQAGSGVGAAVGGIGGTLVGGIAGTAAEHMTVDAIGWEYIVRESKGDLISVTQREQTPLPIGQRVLVIAGNQARIVPDYAETEPPARNATEPSVPAPPVAGSSAAPGPPVRLTPLAAPSPTGGRRSPDDIALSACARARPFAAD